MRVWRPKRKKSDTEDLISRAEAEVAPPREEVQRIRINRVHMAAVTPPVVGLALLLMFPFLVAEPASPGIGVAEPGPSPTGGGPRPPVVTRPDGPQPPQPGSGDPRPAPPVPEAGADPQLEAALRNALDGSIRYEERLPALDLLARSRDPRALEALLQAAVARDSDTRALAARGLSRRLPDDRAARALQQLMQDPAPAVTEVASLELSKATEARQLLLLGLTLPDPVGQVHLNCIRGLVYQGRAEDVALLMQWTRHPGPLADAAVDAVWSICQRTGAPPPPGLPPRLR